MSLENGLAKAFGLTSEHFDRMALLSDDVSSAAVPVPPRTDR
jgi:hypothetical protein